MITTELGIYVRDRIGVTEDWNADAPHFRNRGPAYAVAPGPSPTRAAWSPAASPAPAITRSRPAQREAFGDD